MPVHVSAEDVRRSGDRGRNHNASSSRRSEVMLLYSTNVAGRSLYTSYMSGAVFPYCRYCPLCGHILILWFARHDAYNYVYFFVNIWTIFLCFQPLN